MNDTPEYSLRHVFVPERRDAATVLTGEHISQDVPAREHAFIHPRLVGESRTQKATRPWVA